MNNIIYKINNNSLNSFWIDFIKIIAFIFMICDHIGFLYYEYINIEVINILRMIGRLSFPLFAFILVYNYVFNTSNKIKHIRKIIIFGLIIQIFYMYVFETYIGNIFLTLGIGLYLIYLIEEKNKLTLKNIFHFSFLLIIIYFLDGGYLSILFILSVFFFVKKQSKDFLILTILFLFLLNIQNFNIIYSFFTLFSAIIIYIIIKLNNKIKVSNEKIIKNKYFFYIIYISHLLLLKLTIIML